MSDSFRAQRASQLESQKALENSLSHLLNSVADDSPPPTPPPELTPEELINEDFRVACGAYVKGRVKLGVRCKYDLQMAQEKLDAGADINSQDPDGWTALHWSCCEGYDSCIKWLVKKRVSPNIQDNDECTPLWISGYNNQYSSAQILLWGGEEQQGCGARATRMRSDLILGCAALAPSFAV